MKRFSLVTLAVLAAGSAVGQQQLASIENFVVAGGKAYYLAPPRLLLAPMVGRVFWSPTGRHVIAQRGEFPLERSALFDVLFPSGPQKPVETTLHLIDTETLEETQFAVLRPGKDRLDDIGWADDGSSAVLTLLRRDDAGKEEQHVFTIDVGNPSLRPLPGWTPDKHAYLYTSTDRTKCILLVYAPVRGRDAGSAHLITGAGLRRLSLPSGRLVPHVEWHDGAYVSTTKPRIPDQYPNRYEQTWHRLDLDGGPAVEVPQPRFDLARPTSVVYKKWDSALVGEQPDANKISPGWIKAREEDSPGVLISANATWVEISPTMHQVAYISEGALFMRPLMPVDAHTFREIQAAEERRIAMNQAKQVGIAAAIFATDNDDFLPSPETYQDAVAKYLKDKGFLKNFVWTFPGGNATDIEDPSRTEMGYIALPGGRVVVYTDTHVRWVPDK